MTIGLRLRLAASAGVLLALAARPAVAGASPRAAADPVIETIAFDGVAMSEHRGILDRIGVRAGDRLTVAARQRIGRRLNALGDLRSFSFADTGLTFSDRPGSRPGRVILVIAAGC